MTIISRTEVPKKPLLRVNHKQYTRKYLSFSFTLSYRDEKNYLNGRAMLRQLCPFEKIYLTIQSKFTTN